MPLPPDTTIVASYFPDTAVVIGGELQMAVVAVPSPQGPLGVPGPPGQPGPAPTQAQILAAVAAILGQPDGIAPQDGLTTEIARAEAAEAAITTAVQTQFGLNFMAWFATLPVTLPSAPGQPWNDGNTLAVS